MLIAAARYYHHKLYVGTCHGALSDQYRARFGVDPPDVEDGFLTMDGDFLNRVLANEHAYKCGQIDRQVYADTNAFYDGELDSLRVPILRTGKYLALAQKFAEYLNLDVSHRVPNKAVEQVVKSCKSEMTKTRNFINAHMPNNPMDRGGGGEPCP